jgi:hypothetical protein
MSLPLTGKAADSASCELQFKLAVHLCTGEKPGSADQIAVAEAVRPSL